MTATYPWGYSGQRLTLAEMEQHSSWSLIDPEMRRRVVAMMDAAQADNVELGVGGGARSTQQQTMLFLSRYAQHTCPSDVVWDGKCWDHVSGASAAPPGSSYHEVTTPQGFALALDMVGDWRWMGVNAVAYGLHDFSDVNNEPWHIQPLEIPNGRRYYDAARDALQHFNLPGTTPPPKPPEDDMKLAVMIMTNTQPPTTYLGTEEPVTQADGTVAHKFWKVLWIDGEDPQAMKMLSDQRAAGAVEYRYGEHVSVSLFYENDVLPSSLHSDGRSWTKHDWGFAPNVSP